MELVKVAVEVIKSRKGTAEYSSGTNEIAIKLTNRVAEQRAALD
jgi:hypothetical protein